MNLGAGNTTGDILLFLHADTVLPGSSLNSIRSVLSDPTVSAGAFKLKIDCQGSSFRIIETFVNLRSRLFGLPYGDQAIFIPRFRFDSVGGFPELPLMEDFEMVRKLRRIGSIRIAQESVTTSARRWKRLGPWKTTLINQVIITGFLLGVSPTKLARFYHGSNLRHGRNCYKLI
jgi:rSAM/selenodomain-associated transferase 2